MPPSIRFCQAADGTRIAFGTGGSGPPVVQTPTWMTHLELDWNSPVWGPWLAELASRHTLVRYDLRGCGLSDREVDDLSLDSWVADLEAVVDAVDVRRFPLFGLCQGGAIAAAYAARHPDRVSRLVLYGSYVQGGLRQPDVAARRGEVHALATLIRRGWGGASPVFRELFGRLLTPAAPPELAGLLAETERHSASPAVAERLWLAFHEIDIEAEVRQIRVPTLVVHCRRDAMVPHAEGRRLATLIPDARFVSLDGANHIVQPADACWADLWREIHAFLAPDDGGETAPDGVFAGLTARERELLGLIARGYANADIAAELGIAPKTVRNHITRIFAKLGVARRAEAIVMARDAGLGRG